LPRLRHPAPGAGAVPAEPDPLHPGRQQRRRAAGAAGEPDHGRVTGPLRGRPERGLDDPHPVPQEHRRDGLDVDRAVRRRAGEGEMPGVLVAPLAHERGNYIAWFRPEWVHTVTWAHPPKSLAAPDRLTPEGSFGTWAESVEGMSTPWQPVEVESVSELRSAL